MAKLKMVCRRCGSDDVLADAYAAWNVETQKWEVESTFDKGGHCNACDGEARIVSVELEA